MEEDYGREEGGVSRGEENESSIIINVVNVV